MTCEDGEASGVPGNGITYQAPAAGPRTLRWPVAGAERVAADPGLASVGTAQEMVATSTPARKPAPIRLRNGCGSE